jgi:hypothetical protein
MPDDRDNQAPDSGTEIDRLSARRDELLRLQEVMKEKLKAQPSDLGVRVWWGFVILGLLVGWMRSSSVWPTLAHGLVFWIAGMFFSIFALDSAEIQSRLAIFLHKFGEKYISSWLYSRALRIR